jgi:hypothetical protein
MEILREIDYLEDVCVDGKVIIKCIFKNWDWEHRLD